MKSGDTSADMRHAAAMHAVRLFLRSAFVVIALLVTSIASAQDAAPKPARKTIVIVRHGHYVPDANDSSPGPGLSPLGIAQARLVAARLAAMTPFDTIVASPMTRADETAKVIAASLSGVPFETDPRLEECTPATRRKEIMTRETPEKMAACAEQLDALFAARFVPSSGTPKRELLVCHGNVTRYLVTRALNVDTTAWLEMSVGHASITQILVEPDGTFRINSVGDIGHIPPNLQTGATGMTDRTLSTPK